MKSADCSLFLSFCRSGKLLQSCVWRTVRFLCVFVTAF